MEWHNGEYNFGYSPEEDYSLSMDIHSPFYQVGILTAEYLRELPYNKEINYNYYLYSKWDAGNYNLPAVFIYFPTMTTNNNGFLTTGRIRIEIHRNRYTENRAESYMFAQRQMQRTILSLFSSYEYKQKIMQSLPFMGFIGVNSSARVDEGTGVITIEGDFSYLFAMYRQWVWRHPMYVPSGRKMASCKVEEVITKVFPYTSYECVEPYFYNHLAPLPSKCCCLYPEAQTQYCKEWWGVPYKQL